MKAVITKEWRSFFDHCRENELEPQIDAVKIGCLEDALGRVFTSSETIPPYPNDRYRIELEVSLRMKAGGDLR